MNKELEVYFKRIKNLPICVDYEKDIVKSVGEIFPNSCNEVEQSLEKLEAIENVLKKYNIENIEELEKILKLFCTKNRSE